MGDVVEFPAREVAPDCLPVPGDRYRPYGLWQRFQPPMLTFVFASRSITAVRYDRLEQFGLRALSDDGNYDGECMIRLLFGRVSGGTEIVITGYGLYPLYSALSSYRVHWVWERPGDEVATGRDELEVRSITINRIDLVNADASQERAETAGLNLPVVPFV